MADSRIGFMWTPEAEARLRELWLTCSATECAAKLHAEFSGHFTKGSVIGKIGRLGLTGKREVVAERYTFSPEQDAEILRLSASGLGARLIAKTLGLSRDLVRRRIRNLNAPRHPKAAAKPKPAAKAKPRNVVKFRPRIVSKSAGDRSVFQLRRQKRSRLMLPAFQCADPLALAPLDTEDRHPCMWMSEEPDVIGYRRWRNCGRPVFTPGASWCAAHASVVYVYTATEEARDAA